MRLLVACPKCNRQYDAGARPIDSRFRCHCGNVVTVRRPLGHDAAVVRCTSCGAPRTEQSTACRYCGADFTLHERDLHTVCPACFARISDQAKYCHHCGVALLPEACACEKTSMACPACGKASRLSHRQIGGVALLECGRCAGFWLGSNVFENLVEKASRDVLDAHWSQPSSSRAGRLDPPDRRGPLYRQCPYCQKLMTRRNYARHSGVVIDACREHGVWFDAHELERILAWVRKGGLHKARLQDTDDALRRQKFELANRSAHQREMQAETIRQGPYVHAISVLLQIASQWFH